MLQVEGVNAFVTNFRDVTKRIELQQLLNKSNALARIGSWEIDLIKGTVYWSDITREIHETGDDYIPDLPTGIHFYKEGPDRDLIEQKVKEAVESGKSWDVELQIITAKNKERWIRSIGETEFANGKCVRVYGSFQDIDQRKNAELRIKESEERFKALIENNRDIISLTDDALNTIYRSPSTERFTGWPPEDLTIKTGVSYFHPDDIVIYKSAISEAIKNPGLPQPYISRFLHKNGYYIWLEGTVTKLPADGVIQGLVFNSRDITERKHAEERLNQLNQQMVDQSTQLLASNKELEQFAFVASHDLQEPLRMVTNYLSLLEKRHSDMFDEKSKKYIHFAVDGAKRMRSLILDLLEFSRVGKIEGGKGNVDINELIQEIRTILANQIEEKSASIHCKDLPVLYAQKAPLLIIFQNLLSNAMKYAVAGVPAEITISATSKDNNWQFEVKDNGIGIDPQFFEKIFVIFQRLHTNEHYSGTGIVLAVTKKIIENRGGKIWVDSEEGKGSTFYFTFKT